MQKKILIIDDEQDMVEILATILEHDGYQVAKAFDGEEGLNRVGESKPDLIVTDIMMPKLDGYAVAEKLKQNAETSQIPIIMLTAKDQQVDRYKGLSLGVAAYIVKLFDLDELRDTIKDILNRVK